VAPGGRPVVPILRMSPTSGSVPVKFELNVTPALIVAVPLKPEHDGGALATVFWISIVKSRPTRVESFSVPVVEMITCVAYFWPATVLLVSHERMQSDDTDSALIVQMIVLGCCGIPDSAWFAR